MKKLIKLLKNEDGQALVLVAIAMTVLIGLTALVIDVGTLYVTRSKLQNAADAAALAGAQDLETINDPVATAEYYGRLNGAENTDAAIDSEDSTKIQVKCSKNVPNIFARIFDPDGGTNVSAEAVAQKIWAGQVLPFISTEEYNPYSPYGNQVIWNKNGSGNFERLNTKDAAYIFDPTKGAIHGNGKMENIQDIEALCPSGRTVYLLSLSDAVIASRNIPITDNNGTPQIVNMDGNCNIGQGSTIATQYLVLLECVVNTYDSHSSEIYVNVKNIYDLGNNMYDKDGNPIPDYPTGYKGSKGSPSRLVE